MEPSSTSLKRFRKSAYRFVYKYRYLHLLALPGLVYMLIFQYLPMYGIIIAFKNYRGASGFWGILQAPWVGLQNFRMFFESVYFGRLLFNTLFLSITRLLTAFPLTILFALLLNEIPGFRFKKTVQTISYLPHFLSWVVISGLLIILLSPETGPVNALIKLLGGDPVFFLARPSWFRFVLVASGIWQSLGWSSIVYLAAISGIPQEQYESAELDGASRLQKMRYITLPGISEIVAIMLILAVGRILNENFEQIFNLYSPVVYESADVFETYVYRAGITETRFSYSAAVGLFKSVVSLVMVVAANATAKKLGSSALW